MPILTRSDLYALIRSDFVAAEGRRSSSARGDRIGVEIELFPLVRAADGTRRQVPLAVGAGPAASINALFEAMVARHGWRSAGGPAAPALEGATGGRITLEPAGQIEYSGPALETPGAVLRDLQDAVAGLADAASDVGIDFLTRGYNALVPESEMELVIAKPRYIAMDRHFAAIGAFGRRMMRGTCALQMNLDFGRGGVVAERWRLANMLAPSLNAIFANSPHVHEGRTYRSFRHEIWRCADPTRTGRLFDRPDLDPVADYLRFALDATVMMAAGRNGEEEAVEEPFTFGAWLGGSRRYGYPTLEDWRLHASTLFPDVRARGWMEIRSMDMLPPEWWGVPLAIVSTLLYNDRIRRESLVRLEGRLRERSPYDIEHDGFWDNDYATGAEIFSLALDAIAEPEPARQAAQYYDRFIARGTTPAEAHAADTLLGSLDSAAVDCNEKTRSLPEY